MDPKMETGHSEEMDMEALSSVWPEDINDKGKQSKLENPGHDEYIFERLKLNENPKSIDFNHLVELTTYSEKGSSQLKKHIKEWEYKQANAVRLLREELDFLSKQQKTAELEKLAMIKEHRSEELIHGDNVRPLDGIFDIRQEIPWRRNDDAVHDDIQKVEAEGDTVTFWKERAMHLEKLLDASLQREQISYDNELRYRFCFNHFPSSREEDIIGKTDVEIFAGSGVKECQDFKREVLERGVAAKREITFETELFGSKTFLIYVQPVFSKAGEAVGVNYIGRDVTDQVRKREKMAQLREEMAVQKAKETELNKLSHIAEETERAKQMLATMSHEIRSPLAGLISMTENLITTKLDKEQRQLLSVILSSGDLVLQLINDIIDLPKAELGVLRLKATNFRPRQVVKHVLQTAEASLVKTITLEGHVAEDVPVEVIGDVLRIRQILTKLISNAIKFTREGKVGINVSVIHDPSACKQGDFSKITYTDEGTGPLKESVS